ncbi:MAG: outer membrane beta-barrel protein [Bryobacteraceae bacterium]
MLPWLATAQQTEEATQPPVVAPPGSRILWSGIFDGHYSFANNHPSTNANQLRNFDVKADRFALTMVRGALEMAPEPFGFKVDIGYGKGYDVLNFNEPREAAQIIGQMYASLKPKNWKGVQVDFGKFMTSAGAEVFETHLNWNYSRSYLFALGPYYHFGGRVTVPLQKHVTAGFQLVQGWNNIVDNNGARTTGFTMSLTWDKIAWSHNYYVGPEGPSGASGMRHFYDTVLLLNPNRRVNAYINYDYGIDQNPIDGRKRFLGIATAVRIAVSDRLSLTPRYEWYNDVDGAAFITGRKQKLREVTVTGDWRFRNGLIARAEFRRDASNQPFFDRGNQAGAARGQTTMLVGFVATIGPR